MLDIVTDNDYKLEPGNLENGKMASAAPGLGDYRVGWCRTTTYAGGKAEVT